LRCVRHRGRLRSVGQRGRSGIVEQWNRLGRKN